MLLTNGKKRIPIVYEDFKQLIDSGFYYVDKSMLIYELLHSGGQNNLITRPRRFGKTIMANMIAAFLSKKVDSDSIKRNIHRSKFTKMILRRMC